MVFIVLSENCQFGSETLGHNKSPGTCTSMKSKNNDNNNNKNHCLSFSSLFFSIFSDVLFLV